VSSHELAVPDVGILEAHSELGEEKRSEVKGARYSEVQIIAILKHGGAGLTRSGIWEQDIAE
jgi:hypothetical protein